MMSNLLIKSIIFGLSSVIVYLIIPDFIEVGASNTCIYINLGVIVYIALAVVDIYEFYKGDKFSIGIQMYNIKSLEEDDSNFNIWHRRIGVVVLILLALAVLIASFNKLWCPQ